MKKSPDHRYLAVKECVASGTKPDGRIEATLFELISGKRAPEAVERAYDIYKQDYKREVMESFLLVESTSDEIEAVLKVPAVVTDAYAHLFFDPEVFDDELDRLNYAHTYDRTEFGSKLKEFAIDLGKESLMVRMSRGSYAVPATNVQDSIRSTAFLMAQLAKVNPARSATAKEALRWAQLALKASSEEAVDNQGNVDRVVMELETTDETTDAANSGIDEKEILH
jgi:hypothetical protein